MTSGPPRSRRAFLVEAQSYRAVSRSDACGQSVDRQIVAHVKTDIHWRSRSASRGDTTMHKRKRRALESDGWRVGTAQEFLALSDDEVALIDLKLALGRAVRTRRVRKRLSQAEVATRIRSSQSRVAKMEAGDVTVSIDLLVRTLLALGASRRDLIRRLGAAQSRDT